MAQRGKVLAINPDDLSFISTEPTGYVGARGQNWKTPTLSASWIARSGHPHV